MDKNFSCPVEPPSPDVGNVMSYLLSPSTLLFLTSLLPSQSSCLGTITKVCQAGEEPEQSQQIGSGGFALSLSPVLCHCPPILLPGSWWQSCTLPRYGPTRANVWIHCPMVQPLGTEDRQNSAAVAPEDLPRCQLWHGTGGHIQPAYACIELEDLLPSCPPQFLLSPLGAM